jgi:hypothetical protein
VPEAHRWTQADVEAALERYRKLTGDTTAVLVRTGPSRDRPFYVVDHSEPLGGFEAYGALAAIQGLEMYCDGYEAGLRARKPP